MCKGAFLLLGLALLPCLAVAGPVQVVDQRGTPVPDAIISWAAPTSLSNSSVVDQIDKRFVPYVSVVRPGTLVSFPNSDDTRHHVYSFSAANTFELKLYHSNDAQPVLFDTPGLVALGCNVHDTMKAYVLVTDEASALSDSTGRATLPDGVTAVRVWHPQLSEALSWVDYRLDGPIVTLPFDWSPDDPQAARGLSDLEQRMQRFRNRGN